MQNKHSDLIISAYNDIVKMNTLTFIQLIIVLLFKTLPSFTEMNEDNIFNLVLALTHVHETVVLVSFEM